MGVSELSAPAPGALAGTVALVTGASSGIGAATAVALAQRGAAVALVARRRERLDALANEIRDGGGIALAIEADISDRQQAEAAVQRTVAELGRLDTLVNNAGIMLLGPGTVDTELASHVRDDIRAAVQSQVESIEPLRPEDIADAIVQIITRDRRVAVNEVLIRAAEQSW
jgi:NADP-dependent 3-hydroxy acid dehydrogenase YdfG